MQKNKQLTHMEDADPRLLSQYGPVSYVQWCIMEAERFAASGRSAFVKQNGGDRIALYTGIPSAGDHVLYRVTPEIINNRRNN